MRSIRTFVFLLIAIFIADSAFAATIMMPVASAKSEMHHCHEHESTNVQPAEDLKLPNLHDQQSSHNHHQCHDCIACLTMLPASFHYHGQTAAPAVMVSQYVVDYASPDTPQLDRPPIASSYSL